MLKLYVNGQFLMKIRDIHVESMIDELQIDFGCLFDEHWTETAVYLQEIETE